MFMVPVRKIKERCLQSLIKHIKEVVLEQYKEPKRDFVYIDDVVDATIFPIFNSVEKNVYEVGSGQARTFEDVLMFLRWV